MFWTPPSPLVEGTGSRYPKRNCVLNVQPAADWSLISSFKGRKKEETKHSKDFHYLFIKNKTKNSHVASLWLHSTQLSKIIHWSVLSDFFGILKYGFLYMDNPKKNLNKCETEYWYDIHIISYTDINSSWYIFCWALFPKHSLQFLLGASGHVKRASWIYIFFPHLVHQFGYLGIYIRG